MNKNLIIFILLFCFGCKKSLIPEEETVNRFQYTDAIAVTSCTFLYDSAGTAYFEQELVVMKNDSIFNSISDSTFLATSGFSLNTSIYPLNISRYEINENNPFQTIILMDQTNKEWLSGQYGLFINSVTKVLEFTQENNSSSFAIGFYSRTNSSNTSIEFYENTSGNKFVQEKTHFLNFLGEHYSQIPESSTANFYDAINESADLLIANPLSTNQSITIITAQNDDGNGSATFNSVLQKCINNDIKVNVINQYYFSYNLYQLALQTGGFIQDNDNNSYSISTQWKPFTNLFFLPEILSGNGKRIKLKCKAERISTWATGYTFKGYLYASRNENFSDPYFWDNLYNDIDIEQFLPVLFTVQ